MRTFWRAVSNVNGGNGGFFMDVPEWVGVKAIE